MEIHDKIVEGYFGERPWNLPLPKIIEFEKLVHIFWTAVISVGVQAVFALIFGYITYRQINKANDAKKRLDYVLDKC